ncbi:MAG: YecA family protein [Gammaproteobacteria bacterium]|nr:YecA family protein [Gammaproteobacteria bacterium]
MLAGLNEQQWDTLGDVFHAEDAPEALMDLFELHGFLTALAISPVETTRADWQPLVSGDTQLDESIWQMIETIKASLRDELDSGDGVELPVEMMPDDEEEGPMLQSWCLGFVEGQMLHDEAWFERSADIVASLSLPMTAFSGAIDDEDLGGLMNSAKQRQGLAERIPDSLEELYLLFREDA